MWDDLCITLVLSALLIPYKESRIFFLIGIISFLLPNGPLLPFQNNQKQTGQNANGD